MRGTISVGEVIAFAGVLVALLGLLSGVAGFLISSRRESRRGVHARIDLMMKDVDEREHRAEEKYVTRRELNGQLRGLATQHRELRKDVAGLGKRFDTLIDSAKRLAP